MADDGQSDWRLEEVDVEEGSRLTRLYFKVMPHELYYRSPEEYVQHRRDLGVHLSLSPEIVTRWQQLKPAPQEEEAGCQ